MHTVMRKRFSTFPVDELLVSWIDSLILLALCVSVGQPIMGLDSRTPWPLTTWETQSDSCAVLKCIQNSCTVKISPGFRVKLILLICSENEILHTKEVNKLWQTWPEVFLGISPEKIAPDWCKSIPAHLVVSQLMICDSGFSSTYQVQAVSWRYIAPRLIPICFLPADSFLSDSAVFFVVKRIGHCEDSKMSVNLI